MSPVDTARLDTKQAVLLLGIWTFVPKMLTVLLWILAFDRDCISQCALKLYSYGSVGYDHEVG